MIKEAFALHIPRARHVSLLTILLVTVASQLNAAPSDPPIVSLEGDGVPVVNGVYLSPYDNACMRVDMPLNVHVVSTPGGPTETVVEAVARTGDEATQTNTGAILSKFQARLTSTCTPGDLLCTPVSTPSDAPYHELWPVPVKDGLSVGKHDVIWSASAEGLAVPGVFENGRARLAARSINVGYSPSSVTVIKKGGNNQTTVGTAQVQLDPEVIVVPVDVVYVVPHPSTPVVPGSDEAGALQTAIDLVQSEFGVSGTLQGSEYVSYGGETFADTVFEMRSHNNVQLASHPADQAPNYLRSLPTLRLTGIPWDESS